MMLWGGHAFSFILVHDEINISERFCIISGITSLVPEIPNYVCSQRHPQEMSHEPDLYKFAALGQQKACLSSVFIQAS